MKFSPASIFIEMSNLDDNHIGREITRQELEDIGIGFGNGASWCRRSSKIAKHYNIEFKKDKGVIVSLRVNGLNSGNHLSQYIRPDIRKSLSSLICCNCGKSDIEIDHKNGYKNDFRLNDPSKQDISDFQPLCKSCNDVKRQFCKVCRNTGKRFDAKTIGFPVSFYGGGDNHDQTPDGCIGCYYHDPTEFKRRIYDRVS